MRFIRLSLCTLLLLFVQFGLAWVTNQGQDAGADVPSGKLRSLSFAPFREGYSPLKEIFPTVEQVDEDLALLADRTHSIRTYSSLGGGIASTPELARKYGVAMIQGAWLGYEDGVANKKEVEALIKSANTHPDVVKRVIVGNEVLLRGDMDVKHLIQYIRQVKGAVKQPVSYADVWSMYMKYPELIKEVDFITIHILPYWEDEPIAVEKASDHLEKIVKQVEDEAGGIAPGKPILIGESGWPSAGRQRGMAVPGVVNEAKFIRDMIRVVNRHGFDYNIVEAFNQPWKSNLEGVVGANWGLFSADREPVFPLTGPVMEDPGWQKHFWGALALWLIIATPFFKKLQALSAAYLIVFLALAQVFGLSIVHLADFLWYTSYSDLQRSYTAFIVIVNALLAILLLQRYLHLLQKAPSNPLLAGWLTTLYMFFIGLAVYKTFGLAVSGRYLSFPLEQFAVPVAGIVGLIICRSLSEGKLNCRITHFDSLIGSTFVGRYAWIIDVVLRFSAIGMIVGETMAFMDGRDFIQAHPKLPESLLVALSYTVTNQQLLAWLLCLLVLSVPFWYIIRRKNS